VTQATGGQLVKALAASDVSKAILTGLHSLR